MKIKRVSLDQFAGVNGVNKEFKSELNIVYGNNESGKSTLIDFIYNSLFRHARTKGREDEQFVKKCFPKKADGSESSTIEGSIEVDIDGKEYKISKVWSKDKLANTKLIKPAGIVNGEEAESEISELIDYGAGLYRSTVFSSQRDVQNISDLLFDDSGKSKELVSDFSQALSDAAQEENGIPSSKIIKLLKSKIDEYCMGWEMENDVPASKGEKGIIRQLFNQKENLENEMNQIVSSEANYEKLKADLAELKVKREELERQVREHNKNVGLIKEKEEKKAKLNTIKENLSKNKKAFDEWPSISGKYERALELQSQLKDAKIVSQFIEVENLKNTLDSAKKALDILTPIKKSDIDFLEAMDKKRKEKESELGGMNINIDIIKVDENIAKFSYVDNGEEISVKENTILEPQRPMKIDVSNHLELEIRPTGIDTAEVLEDIEKIKKDFSEKCKELGCETIERANDLKNTYEDAKQAFESAEQGYQNKLKNYNTTWSAIKELRDSVKSDLEEDAVIAHFSEVDCTDENGLNSNLSEWKAKIDIYKGIYNTIDELSEIIANDESEKKKLEDRINEIGEIEGENGEEIQKELDDTNERIREINEESLPQAKSLLVEKKPLAQYLLEIDEIDRELEEAKRIGNRWLDIRKRFTDVQHNASQIDVTILRTSFVDYIQKLTGGSIEVEDLDNALNLKMKSGNNQLTDSILSDGTRETVELAFRLAMLDEIYPSGGGFAVLDDPLVNMDPERTEKSCKVLKEFSKRNQVIFVTCHPELIDIFGENEINKIEMP